MEAGRAYRRLCVPVAQGSPWDVELMPGWLQGDVVGADSTVLGAETAFCLHGQESLSGLLPTQPTCPTLSTGRDDHSFLRYLWTSVSLDWCPHPGPGLRVPASIQASQAREHSLSLATGEGRFVHTRSQPGNRDPLAVRPAAPHRDMTNDQKINL